MDKSQVAEVLEEIALLLDLQGENPFKSRAYQSAARMIRGLEQDLGALVASGRLSDLKGIGEALSEKITTLVRTGHLPYLEDLRASVSAVALELLRVPGLGPRKARALVDRLGIRSLGELEYACHENRLVDLEGFGARTQEKILHGIERLKQYGTRFLLGDALPQGEELQRALERAPGVGRAALAGAVRRRCETVERIDLVASGPDPRRIATAFASLPMVERQAAPGDGRVSAAHAAGTPVDLRAVPDGAFALALLQATGSERHWEALRARAAARGLDLGPDALRRGHAALPCPGEAEVYAALGLPFIPPELREEEGEIEAAEAGMLPHLVEEGDVRGIFHVHSTWSDGRLSIEDLVRRCAEIGYEYVGISDHSQSARYARGLTPESLARQQAEIDAARARHRGIRVLKGSEVDILPDGSLDYPEEVLDRLDFVVASVHSSFGLPIADQTRRIVRALGNPRTTILGHPTGRLLLARESYAVDLETVARAAARAGVFVEINANPHRLDLDTAACRRARALGARFAIDPDAHDDGGLTDVRFGVAVARRAGVAAAEILNTLPAARLDEALRRWR